jgi:cellobiose epimerase
MKPSTSLDGWSRVGRVAAVIALGVSCTPRSVSAVETPAVPVPPRSTTVVYVAPSKASYLKLAAETEASLRQDVLDAWFPRSVDPVNGGFRSDFARDWQPRPSGGKFSVFQGRMTWITAQVVLRRPELKEQYLPYVRQGVDYLSTVLWDNEYGGFYWGLGDNGQVSPAFTDGKHLYGISFCIYGSAAAYQATQDPKALDLAQRAFRWIEQHAHDNANGGYHEWLKRDGTPVTAESERGASASPFPPGYKSMNTHIHLLEAFAQLYAVWKDDLLRQRLEELLAIVRDRISVEPGVMNLYFTADWRAVPDHDSYGHDIEAGYLMIEAEEALGRAAAPKTERMARMLVDHGLAHGWDETLGGFYRDGVTFGQPEDKAKEWWVQVEGLNVLLLMHERYGRQDERYFKAFQQQWQFIKDYQIDHEFHGLYEMVGPDGRPTNPGKGRIWKAAYHDGRALLNVSERLRRLAESAN